MTYGEKAAELKETLNCGQAVVVALADLAGLSEDKAKALATGLGGGLRCGEACGAYTGAVLALSLTVGADGMGKPGGPVAETLKEFSAEFKEQFGAIRCNDLLAQNGCDHAVCNGFCAWCADKAAEIIEAAEKIEEEE